MMSNILKILKMENNLHNAKRSVGELLTQLVLNEICTFKNHM